jgi:hypothetical protein
MARDARRRFLVGNHAKDAVGRGFGGGVHRFPVADWLAGQ